VPVAHAPATAMCGSEPVLCSARPAASSGAMRSANRAPALTRTVDASAATSTTSGSSARFSSRPSVATISLNE
jgi:hypothetical protein